MPLTDHITDFTQCVRADIVELTINPVRTGRGGGGIPSLKKTSDNPYLKILDFWLRMPILFFSQKFSLRPLIALLGHPVQK